MTVKEGETTMAILGAMRELGTASAEEHQKTVDLLAATGMTDVWLVGEEFEQTHTDFRKFKDVEAVKAELQQYRPQGRLILIKGSNSTKLYQLPQFL
jgi:UDP-N-acetylmuramoyl-tripeptide--D-alanyl-D-alanine ligase